MTIAKQLHRLNAAIRSLLRCPSAEERAHAKLVELAKREIANSPIPALHQMFGTKPNYERVATMLEAVHGSAVNVLALGEVQE